jgi:hypothetical protein
VRSRVRPLTLAAALVLPTLAIAGGEHVHDVVSPNDRMIRRSRSQSIRRHESACSLRESLPPLARCGTPADLSVRIVTQGFVTSRLEAEFVGEAPAGASLEFHPPPLRGMSEELRELRITLTRPGLTDLTIAFRSHNEAPDIGGRDRIHFLLRCQV